MGSFRLLEFRYNPGDLTTLQILNLMNEQFLQSLLGMLGPVEYRPQLQIH